MNEDFAIPPEPSPLALRQDARMAAIPALYKTKHEQLAVELALRLEEPEAIFARYGYTAEDGAALIGNPAFGDMLTRVAGEVQESGLSYRVKARAIAEELLPHAFEMATDPMTSSAVRADLIKWAAKVGGLEPSTKGEDAKGGGGFSLSITFAGEQPTAVLTAREPITLEG